MKKVELEAEIQVMKALVNKKALELHTFSLERTELEHQIKVLSERIPALQEAENAIVKDTGAELKHLGSLLHDLNTHNYQP